MILTIHQPEHLPWLGFFNKMAFAEQYVLLDGVQYRKNYFQNRNQILGTNGKQWLSVPVEQTGHSGERICDIRIANDSNPKWKEKYIRTIKLSYCKHPFFNDIYPFFEGLLNKEYSFLVDFNLEIIFYFCDVLNIHPKFVRSSALKSNGLKSDLILSICRELNADTYIAGPSGRDYLKVDDFVKSGIKVLYNDFVHPTYEQKNKGAFVPYLSILDLLMNVDNETARRIVCTNKYWSEY